MGKEFVVERQRIERKRMRNRWFYITSLIAALGIIGWIVGGALWVFIALILILGVNIALPLETYLRLRGALARDRARTKTSVHTSNAPGNPLQKAGSSFT